MFSEPPPSITEPTPEWTGAEESLFRVLHNVFFTNYCAIARLLETKTCHQVFEFANHEVDYIPTEEEEEEDKGPARKKKKKNRYVWYELDVHLNEKANKNLVLTAKITIININEHSAQLKLINTY